jgi:DNA-3-methyladenine glycosylase I
MDRPLRGPVIGADGKARCVWPGADPLYVAYHDTDWGVPEQDDRALFEKLILDGFQAGLSWITILRKRDHFRRVFDGFQPHVIVGYGPEKIAALMADAGIVRNRGKIEGTVRSARVWLDIMESRGSFARHLWDFVDGRPVQNSWRFHEEVPTRTKTAEALSKDLKARGFTFCGPTIVYAFMEAVGMVNDHLAGCFRHAECAALGREMTW